MIGALARLSRSLPLVVILVVLAVVIYFVVTYRHSRARAKEVLIRVFTVICAAIAIFFGLVSLYAVADGNVPVLELALSFVVIGIVGLGIVAICRWNFKRHNPHYRWKAEKARIQNERSEALQRRFGSAVRAFFEALFRKQ